MQLGLEQMNDQIKSTRPPVFDAGCYDEMMNDDTINAANELNAYYISRVLKTVGATEAIMALIDTNGTLPSALGVERGDMSDDEFGELLASRLDEHFEGSEEGLFNNIGKFFEKLNDNAATRNWDKYYKEVIRELDTLLKGPVGDVKNINTKKMSEIYISGIPAGPTMDRFNNIINVLQHVVKAAEKMEFDIPELTNIWKKAGFNLNVENGNVYYIQNKKWIPKSGVTMKESDWTPKKVVDLLNTLKKALSSINTVRETVDKLRSSKRKMFETDMDKETKKELNHTVSVYKDQYNHALSMLIKHTRNWIGIGKYIENNAIKTN